MEGHASDVLTEPRIRGSDDGLTFISGVLTIVDSGTSRVGVLGPVLDPSVPRLDLTWWSLAPGAPLEPHRTSLALPDREMAVFTHPFDLEGDGRPEIAVLTAPRPHQKLSASSVSASVRATAPIRLIAPFFSATTNINSGRCRRHSRRAGAGSDLLIATGV
jgi:hypothetical protein